MGNQNSGVHSSPPGHNQLKRVGSKQKIPLPDDYSLLCQALIELSQGDGVGENISRRVFVKHFNSQKEGFGELLFEYYVTQQTGLDVHYLRKETFLKICAQLFELPNDIDRLKYFLQIFASGKDHLKKNVVEHFFTVCYYVACDVSTVDEIYDISSPDAKVFMDAVIKSVMKNSDSISIEALYSWLKKNFFNVIRGVHLWVSKRLHQMPSRGSDAMKVKEIKEFPDNSTLLLNPLVHWLLSSSLPITFTQRKQTIPPFQRMLSGQLDPHTYVNRLLNYITPPRWIPLYNSRLHGLSLNRFKNQVFFYRGSTVLILELEQRNVYCVGVDEEWRESTHRWGGENCVLIQILPDYRVIETGAKLMYMNVSSRGYPFGIHVGLAAKHPTIEIDQELAVVHVKKIPYRLINVEVWGSAGEEIRNAQAEQKKWEAREVEKHRRVSMDAIDWGHNPDKYLLDLASSKTTDSYVSNS